MSFNASLCNVDSSLYTFYDIDQRCRHVVHFFHRCIQLFRERRLGLRQIGHAETALKLTESFTKQKIGWIVFSNDFENNPAVISFIGFIVFASWTIHEKR